ncbi:MAG TPA: hypothetical protein DCY07_02130, partial [Rhodospirillaceae bacterium]|nr:hypothetical protein [Rhodospirillaceae bacterium]
MTIYNKLKYNGILSAALLLGFCLPVLGGCAAGPDFKTPEAPTVASYGPDGMPKETVQANDEFGGIQRFLSGGDVPAAWWTLYQSNPLNDLISKAVVSNASLDAARAALRAADETAAASYGSFFPAINGSASVDRNETASSNSPFTLYNTSVAVSYAPDIFGGARRTSEARGAVAQAQRFELEAAYLTLTANVATTAIQEASLREQIKATKEIIAAQEKQLEMMKTQLDVGAIAKPAYLSQLQTVAASKTALPPLEQQLAANRHLMSVLLGQFPSESAATSFTLANFKLPAELPLSLPSKLVEQRPDIRAARANLQAANAEIGIAMAAMLPQFPLTASYGVGASRLADLFSPGTALWGLGAGILQPIFQGGELLHNKRAKEALFDQAAAQYRATVLSAFQNVADSLKALESDAQALAAQVDNERAA